MPGEQVRGASSVSKEPLEWEHGGFDATSDSSVASHISRQFISKLAPRVDFGGADQQAQGRWSIPADLVMVWVLVFVLQVWR